MITLLGAGGAIANHCAQLLAERKKPFRLVSRSAHPAAGATETLAADLADPDDAIRAVVGSSVVVLLVGLKYDHKLWADLWPRILANTIEACQRAGAKLLFFDNVYMYGRVEGAMTEETPFRPCSRKGEIRARIATSLIEAWQCGRVTGMIARAADFYGPATATGLPNTLIFDPYSKKQKASWLVNDAVPHSLTYTPDAARGLLMLLESDKAWNQTWHLPTTANPPTGREFIAMAAEAMRVAPKYRVLRRPVVRAYGWFNPVVGEIHEMLYQYDAPYRFDSSKFARAFGVASTPYAEGIQGTAASYRGA
ncbi:MAG TPA: NAD-dependent epimerase/dehydratase family protein [Acidobacteriaceae bacterium]|jgi:nucleoside-diphosphate-sugar epimerase|nr:NAD-dependent epimerase/dehydratase family protein [Acidobacteriaceae bacterium]